MSGKQHRRLRSLSAMPCCDGRWALCLHTPADTFEQGSALVPLTGS